MNVLFIAGSLNQTRQMHAIAEQIGGIDAYFSPFYVTGPLVALQKMGLMEMSIAGKQLAGVCLDYLQEQNLPIDYGGTDRNYDLVVTCTDQFVPSNVRRRPVVLVQEGMLDPAGFLYRAHRALPWLVPTWMAGTAATGQSQLFTRFCVASEGYRDLFVERGIEADKIVVTGIPNFDNCKKYYDNDYPHHGYVLVCTSDARETFKSDDRIAFIEEAKRIAGERQLVFKLHPNEKHERAAREIHALVPDAIIETSGRAEEMVANASELICQYSSLAFVGIALRKKVHSYFDIEELKRLCPVQNASSAERIARVCRTVLDGIVLRRREHLFALQETP